MVEATKKKMERMISVGNVLILCMAVAGAVWTLSGFVYNRYGSDIRRNEDKILFVREIQVEVTTTLEAIRDDISEIKADVKAHANVEHQ